MATTVFFNVFIVNTVGKGHGSMLRPLFLIGVWHIKWKRRAWPRWIYNLLGGLTDRMTYARVVIVLRLYLLERCLDPVFRTLIKTCNFIAFYEFLIHLGVHDTFMWVGTYHYQPPLIKLHYLPNNSQTTQPKTHNPHATLPKNSPK